MPTETEGINPFQGNPTAERFRREVRKGRFKVDLSPLNQHGRIFTYSDAISATEHKIQVPNILTRIKELTELAGQKIIHDPDASIKGNDPKVYEKNIFYGDSLFVMNLLSCGLMFNRENFLLVGMQEGKIPNLSRL